MEYECSVQKVVKFDLMRDAWAFAAEAEAEAMAKYINVRERPEH